MSSALKDPAVYACIAIILALIGVEQAENISEHIVDGIAGIIAVVGIIVAFWGRKAGQT